ncbi:hypothetical protein [Paenibacillus lutrae]|nr:hypothetical protein [Paenibacillus lutrae]
MVTLETIGDILKVLASLLSIVFGVRKLYRWIRKRSKRKTHRK